MAPYQTSEMQSSGPKRTRMLNPSNLLKHLSYLYCLTLHLQLSYGDDPWHFHKVMGCIYTIEYYSVQNNDILKFACKWIEQGKTMLSVATQTQKDEHGMDS